MAKFAVLKLILVPHLLSYFISIVPESYLILETVITGGDFLPCEGQILVNYIKWSLTDR